MNLIAIRVAATKLAEAKDADIYFYNGEINPQYEAQFVQLGADSPRRKNVILILCTRGGAPDAAYRMARFLQEKYEKFSILVCGKCKSSGTLMAIGAHEIIMGDHGELGPLDIQLGKKDELFENDSGLTVMSAITELENKAYDLFEAGFVKLKYRTEGRMTTKTATSLATELAIGMITPIISQIDPMHVGEVSRAMKVAKEYGERLGKNSKNLQEKALHSLINGYPSHGFVIDRSETKELFVQVRSPDDAEYEVLNTFARAALSNPLDEAITFIVSHTLKEVRDAASNITQNAGQDQVPPDEGDQLVPRGGEREPEPEAQPAANVTPIHAAGGHG